MEATLWKLQRCDPDGGGLPASYNTEGVPCCESTTSIETGALALLPYVFCLGSTKVTSTRAVQYSTLVLGQYSTLVLGQYSSTWV